MFHHPAWHKRNPAPAPFAGLAGAASGRPGWLVAAALSLVLGFAVAEAARAEAQEPYRIGSRRELFVDSFLIHRLENARLQLHHPVPRQVALVHDAPWEGTGCGYHSVFFDGKKYRMYYKAWHLEVSQGKLNAGRHPLYCCYAESEDGIRWVKPKLGLHEFQGSKENNIVLAYGTLDGVLIDPGHVAVFLDTRPGVPPEGRFKAVVRCPRPHGLVVLQSPDGLRWRVLSRKVLFVGRGAFDSQNLAFWDPVLGKYRAYWRIFSQGKRAIRTATSPDLIHWSDFADLRYEDSPAEHLYTNQIKPYFRAPHLLIGFPTRYVERGWSPTMEELPQPELRRLRSSAVQRYGTAITEGLLMASRDGVLFRRWNEAFLRPGPERPGTWHYGHQYIAWHVVQTRGSLPGAPPELSLYATERYWHGPGTVLRRYTLRLDGFVSVNAPLSGGELVTRPLVFQGDQLHLNFATSAAGSIRVEIQDAQGRPLPGFGLAECYELFGDTVDRVVRWKSGSSVRKLAGKVVRLRFVLRDADLYSFRFAPREKSSEKGKPASAH